MNKPSILAFVRKHGVVLASAKGPAPRLSEFVAGRPVKGSWWADPDGKAIFRALQQAAASPDVLVCRLIEGKVTFVHRRLWPALVTASSRFSPGQLAQVRERHTPSGRHVTETVAFPEWVPPQVMREARRLSLAEAIDDLRKSAVAA